MQCGVGRSAQRCWTVAGDAAAPNNGGAPGSGALAWTPAPGDNSGHGTPGEGTDGVDGWLQRHSDGMARRRFARGNRWCEMVAGIAEERRHVWGRRPSSEALGRHGSAATQRRSGALGQW
jgi:hypothetical protein